MRTRSGSTAGHGSLREEIRRRLEQSPESDGAYVRAADLVAEADLRDLPELRLAILRSFTLEPLVDVLRVKAFLAGFRLEVFLGEFNQYAQEILDPTSPLYRFAPTLTFVAVRLEDLCPPLLHEAAERKLEEVIAFHADVLETLGRWIAHIEDRCATNILLSNFLVPTVGALGLAETQTEGGQVAVVRRLNAELVRLRERSSNLYLFDLELLAGKIGKQRFCDPAQLYRSANPYRLSIYPAYGEFLWAHIRALLGQRRKCLVLDLDDTLWGGVVGEDGMKGLLLSDTYPGNCYKDFQRAIHQLHARGVILALNSKNNHDDAIEVIRSHPDMLLREEHFSATRINWEDKAENLRSIAEELGLGLDALVFVDDSAAECERVRQACPEVLVVELPRQREAYRTAIEDLACFDQLSLTSEDRARGELYRGQARRRQLAAETKSLEEFFASLDMRGTIHRNEASHVRRIAQMTQKTNQFNLTTRRYTEAEVARFMERGVVYSMRLEDRFGDNGIVAVAIVFPGEGSRWHIDTLLISCRVIMRTIEDTLIAEIARDARAAGVTALVGDYVPSEKNGMVKDFYARRGFGGPTADGSRAEAYVLDLTQGAPLAPSPWVRLAGGSETGGAIRPS